VVLPAMLRVRVESKREKLLQYAARVWNIVDGVEDERIGQAIARTEAFFREVGVGTRLADYGLGVDAIEPVVKALEAHRMVKLGEHRDVTAQVSRKVLELCL
jgi:NADP-dependent alcohol dehydrogenase